VVPRSSTYTPNKQALDRARRVERELGLPEGPPFELPLLIQDRNFDVDEEGQLTGRLVHKTDPDVMEAFAPFTVVNGKVWPVLEVEPAMYRFRLLNGSNARTYRLVRDLYEHIRARPDRADRDRPRTAARSGGCARGRAGACVGGTRGPPGRLLGPRRGRQLTLLNTAALRSTAPPSQRRSQQAADLDGLLPIRGHARARRPGTAAKDRSRGLDRLRLAGRRRCRRAAAMIALVEMELDDAPNCSRCASSNRWATMRQGAGDRP
jgi:spore coat protein A